MIDLLIIFFAQLIYVSTMTLRWIILLRGNRLWATIISLFEVSVWVYALSLVVTNIDQPLRILVYALGYAAGTATGCWLEEKLALGHSMLMAVVREESSLASHLRKQGFAVTSWQGAGKDKSRQVLLVAFERKLGGEVKNIIESCEPDAFCLNLAPTAIRGGFVSRHFPALPAAAEEPFGSNS